MSLGLIQDTTEVTTPPAATTPAATTPAAAAGSSLAPTLMIGIMILIAVLIIAAVAIGWRTGGTGGAGRYSWLDYGNFFIVAIGMIVVLFAFLVAIGSATDLDIFNDPTEVLAMLTALFGVIAALVGTYFGVKAGSDAAAGAQDLANIAIAPTQAPTVVSVDPLPNAGGVPANVQVTATFSKDMNPATLNTNTFTLTDPGGNRVGGAVTYDIPTKRATFSPGANLAAGTAYTATVTTDVRDQTGNGLPVPYAWQFTT